MASMMSRQEESEVPPEPPSASEPATYVQPIGYGASNRLIKGFTRLACSSRFNHRFFCFGGKGSPHDQVRPDVRDMAVHLRRIRMSGWRAEVAQNRRGHEAQMSRCRCARQLSGRTGGSVSF